MSSYSSETAAWSSPTSIQLSSNVEPRGSVFTRDALYFTLRHGKAFLKYDLRGHGLSVIRAPAGYDYEKQTGVGIVDEDGGLGFIDLEDDDILHLWSWLAGPDYSVARWALGGVIKLETLLPIHFPSISLHVVGFAEGADTIFISTDAGIFALELKSERAWKLKSEQAGKAFDHAIIPYMAF